VSVPALVLIALALVVLGVVVAVAGVLALGHRLPRNRVIGIRTRWTMSRVDAFRRANRAAAPVLLASGGIGVVGGLAAATSAGATAVTLLVGGLVGMIVLLGAAGAVGTRYAAADEAAEVAARASAPSGPCTLDGSTLGDAEPEPDPCAADGATSSCGGSCALCPRAAVATPPAE
jgi:hypothetical protein